MKAKSKRISIYVLTGMLNLTLLTGCQSSEIANQSPPVQEDTYIPSKTASAQLGEFSTQDIYGNIYTQDIFKDYDLTLVNVFTTWCTPCVEEIPDLEKLYQDMSDRGIQVVGVLLDVLNEKGEIQQDMLEKSQLLATKVYQNFIFY